MGPVADAYAGSRERIVELVSVLSAPEAAADVPACPEWSVRDVVAHVAGVVDDVLAGRLDGIATEPWTDAQVAAGRGRPLGELLERWCADAPRFEAMLDVVGDRGRQAVADVVTHEHDIRGALARPGARRTDAVAIGLGFTAVACADAARGRGLSLGFRSTTGEHFGPADAASVLTGPPFELLRALTGRRSEAQLLAMSWSGRADAALGGFTYGPFRPAAHAIAE